MARSLNRRPRGDAGELVTRKNRVTGTLVTVYRAAEQGLEDGGYATVCGKHTFLVCSSSQALAIAAGGGRNILDWCSPCQCIVERDGHTMYEWGQCQWCGAQADDIARWNEKVLA